MVVVSLTPRTVFYLLGDALSTCKNGLAGGCAVRPFADGYGVGIMPFVTLFINGYSRFSPPVHSAIQPPHTKTDGDFLARLHGVAAVHDFARAVVGNGVAAFEDVKRA